MLIGAVLFSTAVSIGNDHVGTSLFNFCSSDLLVRFALKKLIASSTSNLLVIAIEQLL